MKNKISAADIRSHLVHIGWDEDRYGNMKRTSNGKLYRVKFQSISVRLEVQVVIPAGHYCKESKTWTKVGGAYLKDVKFNDAGELIIGRHIFKKV